MTANVLCYEQLRIANQSSYTKLNVGYNPLITDETAVIYEHVLAPVFN